MNSSSKQNQRDKETSNRLDPTGHGQRSKDSGRGLPILWHLDSRQPSLVLAGFKYFKWLWSEDNKDTKNIEHSMGNPWVFLRMIYHWWIFHIYASLLAGRWWSVVAWWLRLSGYVLTGRILAISSVPELVAFAQPLQWYFENGMGQNWRSMGPVSFFWYAYNRLNMYQPSKFRVRGYPILSWKRLSNSLAVQGPPRCFAAFARLGCRISPVDAFFPARFGPIFLWWQMNDVMSKTGSVPARL